MSKPINVITEMDTLEVSLVDKGANQKIFALRKTEAQAMDEIIKAVLATPVDGEDAMIEGIVKAAKTDDKDKLVAAAKAAVRLLNGFKDQMDSDTVAGIVSSAGYTMKSEAQTETQDPTAGLPAEIKKQLDPMFKALKGENEVLRKALNDERDARIEKELTESVAKSYDKLGEHDKIVSLFKGLSTEQQAVLKEILVSANARVEKGSIFQEVGHDQGLGATSLAELESKVAEIQKSDAKVSTAEAWDIAVQRHPDLYQQYLAEKGV